MHQTIIDLLNKAADANSEDNFRRGNVIYLPTEGSLIVAGDIHGHRRNFERIIAFASLDTNPDRHIILQEIIHGGPEDQQGGCLSYKLLFDVARYKLSFPHRVHIIMGNHDTAFISDIQVMKDGKEMSRPMYLAMQREFRQACPEIIQAIRQFLFSQPLAVRCDNRLWISHSLPADRFIDKFDTGILSRPLQPDDLHRPGSAYLLTWGRRHSQALLDKMAEILDVDLFILGHQHQQQGWTHAGKNLIIIASDHNHGCLLSLDLTKPYTLDELISSILPLTSIPA